MKLLAPTLLLPLAAALTIPPSCISLRASLIAASSSCGDQNTLADLLAALPDNASIADVEASFASAGCRADQVDAAAEKSILKYCGETWGELRKRAPQTPPRPTNTPPNDDEDQDQEDNQDEEDDNQNQDDENQDDEDNQDQEEEDPQTDDSNQPTDEPDEPTPAPSPTNEASPTDEETPAETPTPATPPTENTPAPTTPPTPTNTAQQQLVTTGADCSTTRTSVSGTATFLLATCKPGLLCSPEEQICMAAKTSLTTSGVVIAIVFAIGLVAAIAMLTFFCCREKRQHKKSEAARIAKEAAMKTKSVSQAVGREEIRRDVEPLMPHGMVGGAYQSGDPFHDRNRM